MSLVVDNMHYFQTKFSVHKINTRYKNQLHIPSVRLTATEECTTYSVIKTVNKLTLDLVLTYILQLQT